jgi:hypothetical protein
MCTPETDGVFNNSTWVVAYYENDAWPLATNFKIGYVQNPYFGCIVHASHILPTWEQSAVQHSVAGARSSATNQPWRPAELHCKGCAQLCRASSQVGWGAGPPGCDSDGEEKRWLCWPRRRGVHALATCMQLCQRLITSLRSYAWPRTTCQSQRLVFVSLLSLPAIVRRFEAIRVLLQPRRGGPCTARRACNHGETGRLRLQLQCQLRPLSTCLSHFLI